MEQQEPKNSVLSYLDHFSDYLILVPIAIFSFFVIASSGYNKDFKFSLSKLLDESAASMPKNFTWAKLPAEPVAVLAPVSTVAVSATTTVLPEKAIAPVITSVPLTTTAPATTTDKTITIKPRDNLGKIFKRTHVDPKIAATILAANKSLRDLRNLKVGQDIVLSFNQNKELEKLLYQPNDLTTYAFTKSNGFRAEMHRATPVSKLEYVLAPINSSIFIAGRKAGLSKKLVSEVVNIFSEKVNLAKGALRGDKLVVLCKNSYVNDKKVGDGEILAAQVTHKGQTYKAVSFTDPEGNTNFYTPDGYSLKTSFLRFPVTFKYISSKFSLARYQPILGIVRPHTGVDFAADIGTPIKATFDGTVNFVGYENGYGKTIKLKHGEYGALYGHLAKFAANLKQGQHVHEGQIIGYIGNTGLSTGPHLHYEFLVNGQPHDPLKVKLPQSEMIAKKYRMQFLAQVKKFLAILDEQNTTTRVG